MDVLLLSDGRSKLLLSDGASNLLLEDPVAEITNLYSLTVGGDRTPLKVGVTSRLADLTRG